MSENKKISELDLVTSNASGDMFAVVQGGVTKRTTMSKIYDYLATAFNVSNYYTKAQVDTLLTEKQDNYDLSNTSEGTDTCPFDGTTSGLAVFTDTIDAKSNKYFVIESEDVLANQYYEINLRYEGTGYPLIMHYRSEAGRIRLHFANIAADGGSGAATNANLYVTFKRIN